MFDELRKKFHDIASIDSPYEVIEGPKEIMELAKVIGISDLNDSEKELFFNSLKDECLADFGHVSEEMFNKILDKIEKQRMEDMVSK
ncbi:MAG: hypothetical protein ABIG39_03610 [Candidatus Micrarchaeota archaeon]